MIATIDFIERKFTEFNRIIFNGSLKPLPFRLTNARTFLGQLRYTRKRKLFGGWKYSDFVLVISKRKDLDETLLEDTIIHEMIHYYILSNQLTDSSAHGKIFRGMQQDINTRFGRKIAISHRPAKGEVEYDTQTCVHYVCVSKFSDGRTGVTTVARTRIFVLWDKIRSFPDVVQSKWYVSDDPFFNRFPRSITVKIYRVSESELEPVLAKAKTLVRDGNVIRVK